MKNKLSDVVIYSFRLSLIIRWKIIVKTIYLYEKLNNIVRFFSSNVIFVE